ncbi:MULTISPECIES: ammonia-forming cytochrome c nitrite reductase [Prevotellaceae]|uniref:nitrite reductase (cytochrome; ammonia-forming) n=2 Tax=Prevotellaceae TaxID=171552 RepID=F9D139_PREDD|nr:MULTISPECIES: ammonia-forming cytochrome c nitrite reductase [Prevotellaceae]AGB27602.1 formate-dependent nitrite reductase, periplasmic cytochrome c552 subunit [Prevotella dentalis DSM 3688]EGQ16718.1 nitrite reductase (cytochrome; ammonia-forming) [Prevotella dentalis DSM 3688]
MAKQLGKWKGWMLFGGSMVIVFVLGLVCFSLLERRAEVASVFNNRRTPMTDSIVAQNEKFKDDFPHEYETWAQTEDTTFRSMYNSSQERDILEAYPDIVIIWAGYAFSRGYNTPRGHRHAIEDLRRILRTGNPGIDGEGDIQPGTCWTCKGPDVPRLMREKGLAAFYGAKWSDWGPEVMNTVGCSDCHDARTMDLKPARPALYEAWKRAGKDVTKASHQEMRSLVCAQCHTEYYFEKDNHQYLKFPQDKGLTCEAAEAYYDSIGFYDYIHPLSKAKILKAQHPGYELFKQGIHGQRGLSCADCHMPYMQQGGIKFTDHHVQSPLAKIDRTCQTCHRQDAETLRQNVYDRQKKVYDFAVKVNRELALSHLQAEFAWKHGAAEKEMAKALSDIRKAQWRWDYSLASHGAAFHAPQEVMRLLANAMNYAKDAQVEITRVVAKHGFTGQIPIPDVSTKEKAQRYIGLDPKALHDKKERFLDTVVPQWVKKAKENKRFITQPI